MARRAYEKALEKEKNATIREVKDRAAKISEIDDVCNLEQWIAKRGKEIDEKYDYRYSVLPIVFGRLVRDRDITWKDLDGLGEEKKEFIRGSLNSDWARPR